VLTCYMCGENKPEADFAFDDIAKGTRQRHCRKCQAAYRRAHYVRTKARYIANERVRVRGHRERNRVLLVAHLSSHPCVDCGESDVVLLEFDHRDPAEKRRDVSKLAARNPWPTVLKEIEKCDVRCANCHRRRTAEQFGWRRALGLESLLEKVSIHAIATRVASTVFLDAVPEGTRRCRACGVTQSLSEFALKNKKTGCRATLCRACQRLYSRNHYRANRSDYLEKAQRQRQRDRDLFAAYMLDFFRTHPCVDCGSSDPLVLDFDHREASEKLSTVSTFARGQDMRGLLAEIAKCDVQCANCHRRRTARQFGWTRFQLGGGCAA
jgi:hypothetical protein